MGFKAVLDVTPEGVVETLHLDPDGKARILVEQDVDPIIEQCRRIRNEDAMRGFRKLPDQRLAMRIPEAVVNGLLAQGIDIFRDPAALRRVVNSPEFAAFRTTEGRF